MKVSKKFIHDLIGSDKIIADLAGVSPQCVYNWRNVPPSRYEPILLGVEEKILFWVNVRHKLIERIDEVEKG
jgi:hypothetical protein